MGITGLLPFIKKSCRSANLRDFSGATVAIDAYSWLHKGAFSCAEKLVKGEKTDGYVFYCAKLLNMLLDIGVKPIMVFDGRNLPSKEMTEKKRRENREKTRQRGKELLCEGKLKEARECFQRCVDVTPEMAREVIEMCRKKSVDYIVAPYEADAQLAYLDKSGMAQIIITEDSDLALFGCNKILFKMDSCGNGLLYEKENLPQSFGSNASKFSFEKFRYMCILSGCDYLASLPGIGLAKACKFFMLTVNTDVKNVLKKLPSYLKMPKLEVTDEYIEAFIKANNTFLYQLVFCPQKKGLIPLNPYPEGVDASDMEYAGKYLPDDIASELAIGNINFKTLKKFCSESESSFSDIKKDTVWDSITDVTEKKPATKVETSAFKFNSQKVKGVKRKAETNNIDKPKNIDDDDEDLFKMYRSVDSSVDYEEDEEDPLANIFEKKPKLSSSFSPVESESKSSNLSGKLCLKRVVKSRFFAPKEDKLETPTVLRENSPVKKTNAEDDITVDITVFSPEKSIKEEEMKSDAEVISTVKSNKENIANRFAKRPAVSLESPSVSSADITSSLSKVERSWLDVIDSESASTTVSSHGLATKLLSVDSTDNTDKKTTPESNIVKIKKTKLISTKILDFRWDKGSSLNRKQISLPKATNVVAPPVVESDIEPVLGSTKCENIETICIDDVDNSLKDTDCDILINEPCEQKADELPLSADANLLSSSQESLTSETVISSINNFSTPKPAYKPGKCRQIGLSKNRKSSDKKISIKETLMGFNFVRKPKNELPVVT